jgi:hypothetical protein
MVEQIMVDSLILLIKNLEQFKVVHRVNHSTCLSDRVHPQHRNANVDCLHARSAGQDWPDCRSTWAVVTHDEVLNWHFAFLGQDAQD